MLRIKYIPEPDFSSEKETTYVITDREGFLLALIEVNGKIAITEDADVYVNGISAREAYKYAKQ